MGLCLSGFFVPFSTPSAVIVYALFPAESLYNSNK